MVLADKIIYLRRKNGWSQEDLAEKMQVSRQAVSKWEGAQAVPDLEKILALSSLFGVTTDYLLKDELQEEQLLENSEIASAKRVTLAQANEYLEWKKTEAVRIAIGSFLCVISVIPLLLMDAASEYLPENLGDAIGLVSLFILVVPAVAIFLFCGMKNEPFDFLDREVFEADPGVADMVRERQREYRNHYAKCNIIGTCFCVLAPVPLFIGMVRENDLLMVIMFTITLLIAGIGAVFFIIPGIRWAAMQKLLQEGSYAPLEKSRSRVKGRVAGVYWLITTAVFLILGFRENEWKTAGYVWPVAGVLFAAVMCLLNLLIDRKQS